MSLLIEIWTKYKPYLVNRTLEFLEVSTLWFYLYLFRLVVLGFRIGGWVESFALLLHEAFAVAALVFLLYYGLRDLISSKGRRQGKG